MALGLSRSTGSRWVKLGYEPEFGSRTTLTHLRRWLREEYGPRYREEKRKKKAALIEALDKRYNELFSPEAERRRQERIAGNRKEAAAKRKKTQ
jgi:hypothetical protein